MITNNKWNTYPHCADIHGADITEIQFWIPIQTKQKGTWNEIDLFCQPRHVMTHDIYRNAKSCSPNICNRWAKYWEYIICKFSVSTEMTRKKFRIKEMRDSLKLIEDLPNILSCPLLSTSFIYFLAICILTPCINRLDLF